MFHLKPQSPQATVCCKVGAAALVHLRPGGPVFQTEALRTQLYGLNDGSDVRTCGKNKIHGC